MGKTIICSVHKFFSKVLLIVLVCFVPIIDAAMLSPRICSSVFLRKLETVFGAALENGQPNPQSAKQLTLLNKQYFNQLLQALDRCKGQTKTDDKIIRKVREVFFNLYNYEIYFPDIKQGIYPFRSTISHLSCAILNMVPLQILKEKIEEFLSIQVALTVTFELAQEKLDRFLSYNLIKDFKDALLSIAQQGRFSYSNRPILLRGHENLLKFMMCVDSTNHSGNRDVSMVVHEKRGLGRRILGGAGRSLLLTIGLFGFGWLAKRYVVNPIAERVKRYQTVAEMAEKFLVRVKDLPLNQIVQESVKAIADLSEQQQHQFLEMIFSTLQQNGVFNTQDRNAALGQIIGALGQVPQEQQERLIKSASKAFGFNCTNDKNDKKEVLKIAVDKVIELPNQRQKQLLQTVKEVFVDGDGGDNKEMLPKTLFSIFDHIEKLPSEKQTRLVKTTAKVFGIDYDKDIIDDITIGQIRKDGNRILKFYRRYRRINKRIKEFKDDVIEKGNHVFCWLKESKVSKLCGNVCNKTINYFRSSDADTEKKDCFEKKENIHEQAGRPLSEIIKEINDENNNDEKESDSDSEVSETEEEADIDVYEDAEETPEEKEIEKKDGQQEGQQIEQIMKVDKQEKVEKVVTEKSFEQEKQTGAIFFNSLLNVASNFGRNWIINPVRNLVWSSNNKSST